MILTLNAIRGGEEVLSLKWKPNDAVKKSITSYTDFGQRSSVGSIKLKDLHTVLSAATMYNDRVSNRIVGMITVFDWSDIKASIDPLG